MADATPRRISIRIVVAVMAGVLIGGLSTGVTFAATSASAGVKACANSHATLALLKKGKCPRGYKATTIGRQGPAGPTGRTGPAGVPGKPGPGAITDVEDIRPGGASDYAQSPHFKVGTIDIQSTCLVNGSSSSADLTFYDTNYAPDVWVSGSADTADTYGESAQPGIAATVQHFDKGLNLVTQHGELIDVVTIPPADNTTAFMKLDLIVWDGTTVTTVSASMFSRRDHCQIALEAVPGRS